MIALEVLAHPLYASWAHGGPRGRPRERGAGRTSPCVCAIKVSVVQNSGGGGGLIGGTALEFAADAKEDRELILAGCARRVWLSRCRLHLSCGSWVVMEAVRRDACALQFASAELSSDRGFLLECRGAGAFAIVRDGTCSASFHALPLS